MQDRVHACLDGEIPREELTPDELSRLVALEAAIAEASEPLRALAVPDLTARVMQALPARQPVARAPGLAERLLAWLWRPRSLTLQFRPAYAFAGMATAALAALVLPTAPVQPVAPAVQVAETPADASAPRLYVQFRLEAPGASQVELAGSFTDWQPGVELEETAPGVFTALVPLDPGVHDYTFVVDGERWVVDPYAPKVADSFGGANSRLFLPQPTGSA